MKGQVQFAYSLMDSDLAAQIGNFLGVNSLLTKDKTTPEIFLFGPDS